MSSTSISPSFNRMVSARYLPVSRYRQMFMQSFSAAADAFLVSERRCIDNVDCARIASDGDEDARPILADSDVVRALGKLDLS